MPLLKDYTSLQPKVLALNYQLTLSLFVLWLDTKNANNAFTLNHFTITTNLFYGCTYFHFILR